MPEMAGKALPGVDTGLRRYGDDSIGSVFSKMFTVACNRGAPAV